MRMKTKTVSRGPRYDSMGCAIADRVANEHPSSLQNYENVKKFRGVSPIRKTIGDSSEKSERISELLFLERHAVAQLLALMLPV